MLYSRDSLHTLRPVPLSREAEEEGRHMAAAGTTPVINQRHIPQRRHISHHTRLMHVNDTMEILLQIDGNLV